ncbi:DUF58 domain-containing protein [Hyperthermus butylicus]|uniref:Conserved archaeal protein n=1 Tax=Hyperthermus butylicus (strain DSM 5456 / JCM 9403 / PLM1-5) TaxID=415426 RepID=A2BMV3_HYPBU|nr:DUF58 domain-containing protein [Hyperthermus butylicus]ABM81314.1 conserved archaeal protein [Hyperthermus butylicus DSM 5456]
MPVEPTPKALLAAASITALLIASYAGVYPWLTGSLAVLLSGILAWSLGYAYTLSRAALGLMFERSVEPETAYEGAPVKVTIRVHNASRLRAEAVVTDAIPARVRVEESPVFRVSLLPGASAAYTYTVKPLPGLHIFSELTVDVVDPLGFFVYRRTVRTPASIKTVPVASLSEPCAPSPVHGFLEAYRRLVHGVGLEFYEVREYQPGDDPRRIVWTATARVGRLMVREDLSELQPRLHMLVDLSRYSWAGEPGDTPGDHIARLAASLARSIASLGGVFGYTLLRGDVWLTVQPGRAGERLHQLLTQLSSLDPIETLTHSGWGLCGAVKEARTLLPRGMLLLVLTGPHALVQPRLEEMASCLAGLNAVVVVVLPVGDAEASRLARTAAVRLAGRASSVLGGAGARLYLAPGGQFVREAWRLIASPA